MVLQLFNPKGVRFIFSFKDKSLQIEESQLKIWQDNYKSHHVKLFSNAKNILLKKFIWEKNLIFFRDSIQKCKRTFFVMALDLLGYKLHPGPWESLFCKVSTMFVISDTEDTICNRSPSSARVWR